MKRLQLAESSKEGGRGRGRDGVTSRTSSKSQHVSSHTGGAKPTMVVMGPAERTRR